MNGLEVGGNGLSRLEAGAKNSSEMWRMFGERVSVMRSNTC